METWTKRSGQGDVAADGQVPGHAASGVRADESAGVLGIAGGEDGMTKTERLKEDLGARREEYTDDIADLVPGLVSSLVIVADKYGVNRDDVVFQFAETFYKLSAAATFEHWEDEG